MTKESRRGKREPRSGCYVRKKRLRRRRVLGHSISFLVLQDVFPIKSAPLLSTPTHCSGKQRKGEHGVTAHVEQLKERAGRRGGRAREEEVGAIGEEVRKKNDEWFRISGKDH